jgi:error-prone DNA polymerase
LGITAIDPVRMNLLFERFISVERGEPPDIDVDFEHERREEVIQHIYQKYGRDRAGMVSAIITYRTRSAVRDVKKALGEERYAHDEERSLALVEELKGFPRHLSIHSGGFTLSALPMIETVPIEPARMEGRTIVQWDKEDLDYIGLLKVDILALGMLSAIQKTLDLIPKPLTIATIPANDPQTYHMIRCADTVGVFQIESRAQMSMLRRLLPENFYDLVVEVAIVRPGPIQGNMVHPYLRRRRKLESSRSPDPRLEPILSRTLGVPLFQEQVMKIAMVMADFTPGEADELRRAIGAWRSSGSIEKMGNRLKQGLLRNGLAPDFVERIFQQIQGFAEYGFPESHAASFALLAYASSYLKCHYPAEFTCSLLNSQPMGFYSSYTLVEDAKRHGVQVLPFDPRFSDWDCTMEQGALRLGFRMVQGLGRAEALEVIQERLRQSFSGFQDFLSRTRLSPRILNRLAMGDAFVCFGLSRREALWEILHLQMLRPAPVREQQLSLFQYGAEFERQKSVHSGRELFSDLSAYQAIRADYDSYHLSLKGHPMMGLRLDSEMSRQLPSTTSASLRAMRSGQVTRISGLVIIRQRPPTAKGTMFATLEDEFGFADLILHAEVFEKYRVDLESSPFVVVGGKVQRDGEMVNLLVSFVGRLNGISLNPPPLGLQSRFI